MKKKSVSSKLTSYEVREIAENLREDLGICMSLGRILDTYKGPENKPKDSLDDDEEDFEEDEDMNFLLMFLGRRGPRAFYNNPDYRPAEKYDHGFFSWADVLGSMLTKPESVHYTRTKCPHCGKPLLALAFSTQNWTWQNYCGRAGDMEICTNCLEQVKYNQTMVN